jgi:hypothetical protein
MVASVSSNNAYTPTYSLSNDAELNSQMRTMVEKPTNFTPTNPILYGEGNLSTSAAGGGNVGYGTTASQFSGLLAPKKVTPVATQPFAAVQPSVFQNSVLYGGSGTSGQSAPKISFTPLPANFFGTSSMGNFGASSQPGTLVASTGSLGMVARPAQLNFFGSASLSSQLGPNSAFSVAGRPTQGNSSLSVLYNVRVNNGDGIAKVVKNTKTGDYGLQTKNGIDWNSDIANQVKQMDRTLSFQGKARPNNVAGTAKDVVPSESQVRDAQIMQQLLRRTPSTAGVTKDIPSPFINRQIPNAFTTSTQSSANKPPLSVQYNVLVNNGDGIAKVVKNTKTGEYGLQTTKGIDWNSDIAKKVQQMDYNLTHGSRPDNVAGTAKDIIPSESQVRQSQIMQQLLRREPTTAGTTKDIPAPFVNNQIPNAFPR